MSYKHPTQSVVVDDNTISIIDLHNHVALNHVKIFRAILALVGDKPDFFA